MKHLKANMALLLAAGLQAASESAALESSPASASRSPTNRHWAFVVPIQPKPPSVRNHRWVRNGIDSFILARLEKEGLQPSPEADRYTLARRLSLDLTGLPPEPEQVRALVSDQRSGAYERLVDELLASPHFGERWGRHWLDLARYADTEGYQIDKPRPHAYVYRNWVIDSFNRDQPFDQFTIEQLAGDLLPNATVEQRMATGFHRNTLMNHEDGTDREEFRCKAKVDRVSTTGTVWLGLTVGCAECHDHKYDPISQREFYQLYAFFDGAEEMDISAPQAREIEQFQREKKVWQEELARLSAAQAEVAKTNAALAEQINQRIAACKKLEPSYADAKAQIFIESTNAPRTYLHVRGDFLRKGDAVQPGVLSALHSFKPRKSDRPDRLDLARWLVDPSNPLSARVAANHFWQHLFGYGPVRTPDDFGVRGESPTHPELLDWLATEFIARGWSRKAMIKLIVMSSTYRQSSRVRSELLERDPTNLLWARQNRLRLESEVVRDAFLAASGLLNREIGGPSFRPFLPEDVKKLGTAGAFQWEDSTGLARYRRGLYIFAQRTVPYPVSMTFDQANPSETCTRRERSNTPLQALTLLNHGIFVECAQALGKRLDSEFNGSTREKITRGFELCLARQPSREELRRLEKLCADARVAAQQAPDSAAQLTGLTGALTKRAEAAAWIVLAQTLLNLEEFITRE